MTKSTDTAHLVSDVAEAQPTTAHLNDAAAHGKMSKAELWTKALHVTPATPLPWESQAVPTPFEDQLGSAYKLMRGENEIAIFRADGSSNPRRDAGYVAHAANAYPKLISWLKREYQAEEGPGETDRPHMIELRALLIFLGEM